MELIQINDISSFLKIKEDWNSLLSRSSADMLFLRHEWLSAWWEAYGNNNELLVILIKDDGRLIGAVPLSVSGSRRYGFPVKKITFMCDSDWTTSDFIIDEKNPPVLEEILRHLLKVGWDLMDLRCVPEESKNLPIIQNFIKKRGLKWNSAGAAEFPYVHTGTPWNLFWALRSVKFRKAVRNKINRITRAGEVGIKRYSNVKEVKENLPIIYDIGTKGWKHRIGNAISSTDKNMSFYKMVPEKMDGAVELWVLYFNGTPIAFEYHIKHNQKIHALISDFNEDFRELSPGSILDFHIMEHLFKKYDSNDDREYDMGSGDCFYKSNWTDANRKTVRLSFYNKSVHIKALQLMDINIIPCIKTIFNKVRKTTMPLNTLNTKKTGATKAS